METAELRSLSGQVLAMYYQMYLQRTQLVTQHREAVIAAMTDRLRQAQRAVSTEVANRFIDLVVEDVVAVRFAWLVRIDLEHEQRLGRALRGGGWPVGLLLNFGWRTPQIRRLFL